MVIIPFFRLTVTHHRYVIPIILLNCNPRGEISDAFARLPKYARHQSARALSQQIINHEAKKYGREVCN